MAAEPQLRLDRESPPPELPAASAEVGLDGLLPRIARGDSAAMAELYDAVAGRLFGICSRLLRDRHLAEDVVAELFGDVWRRADRFDPARGSALTWLATMARRRCIDKLRSRGLRRAREAQDHERDDLLVVEDQHDLSAPFELVARRDQASIVGAALGRLPEHQRRALELAFGEGLSHSEVASALDLPLGTIKSQIRRGLLLLEQLLPTPEVER
ncbi:sigma-70 family RNA polymerase sigma factor [Engelhardtia mirabilis]